MSARCPHCGVPVEGASDDFCCAGCEMAFQIVQGAGLEAWYEDREQAPSRPQPVLADWSAVSTEVLHDGAEEVRLAVDGLRCASCVWVVENVLDRTEGVENAHVSYATGRATISWDPAKTDLARVTARIAALGYQPRPVEAPSEGDRDVLMRLGIAAFCTANLMLLTASLYSGWASGMEPRFQELFRWGSLALSTPVALWSAAPFYAGAISGLKVRVLHMDLPISLAVLAMWFHGVASTLMHYDGYLDSMGMLVTLLLAGRVLEARGRRSAAAAAAAIASSLPSSARRVVGEGVETVRVDQLLVGDLVEVGLGEEVPADGMVVHGQARVQLSLLTGEADPVALGPGERVVAGAPVVAGALTVRVQAVGEATLGQRMANQVLTSVDRGLEPTPADRLAPYFTALTLAAAGVAFVGWGLAAGWSRGIEVSVSVLVVACPCALGLSYPVAVSAGISSLARRGLLVGSGDVLLRLARVDLIALDKTGTVTGGMPRVVEAHDAVLRVAAGLERGSSHPIAHAILEEATRRGLPLPRATDLQEVPGVGVEGELDGVRWRLHAGGPGEVLLTGEGAGGGIIKLRDVRRQDAGAAVTELQRTGPVVLLTGDAPEVARRLAEEVGANDFLARKTPEDNAAWILEQQEAGHEVLFVGDGLNDGPALVMANVGLAMRGGATSSVLAADGVVAEEAMGPVVAALRVSKVVQQVVRGNLQRSVAYNVLAVMGALAGVINPLLAAILMPLSSAMVLVGALRVEPRVSRLEEAP